MVDRQSKAVTFKEPMKSQVARVECVLDKLRILGVNHLGSVLEGSGTCILSGPLDQSKTYFEILLDSPCSIFAVGMVPRHPNSLIADGWRRLTDIPDALSIPLEAGLPPGSVIGVQIDISDFPPSVTVFVDNVEVKRLSKSVRGDVWPSVEIVGGTATVVLARERLRFLDSARESRGFNQLMVSRSIL